MPYLNSLATKYGQATNWSDITHPSLPNYLAVFGGSTFGVSTDCDPGSSGCAGTAPSVFGQALAAGKTAKTYAESAVSNCQTGYDNGYDVNHVPWVYFPGEASQCNSYSVPLGTASSGALASDISSGNLPNVGEVVPNLTDDGHDGTLAQADTWLQTWMPKIMSGPDYTSGHLAIVVLFDEGETTEQVPMVVINPAISGTTVTTALNHYALTRFIDEVLHTTALRNASSAPDIAPMFGITIG